MASWADVASMHLCLATYFSPPDLVCVILTSRDLCQTYGNAETYRAVARSYFGPVEAGPRGHLSRRQRRKKGTWRAGDGAKARLSLLWLERTRNNVLQLQNAHLLQQREYERRWVLQEAATVMRTCAYASRQQQGGGGCCSHSKLRMWTSATMVAAKYNSSRSQERPASHHGVRCSRCKKGPITGSCFRCAAGCRVHTKRTPGSDGEGATSWQQQQLLPSSSPALRSQGELARAEGREQSGSSGGSSGSGGGGGRGPSGDCYTLCQACFSERRQFHPPHPFARLRAGFAEPRLSGPVLYEAVCGDCSFGSLVLIRPLKTREPLGDPGTGDLWAVPVRVEAVGPLPLSQVKSRIAAGDRDDNRGLAFASKNWRLRPQQYQHQWQEGEEEGGEEEGPFNAYDPLS